MVFLETPVFTRPIRALMDDDQYRLLQLRILVDPAVGDLIPGSGGLRKVRCAIPGSGKRGGARVIYYLASGRDQIYLLLAYAKRDQADLTPDQLRTLRALVLEEFG
ncbi:MAG: type II toxin-antitoxin system RelE/ParE family toxin [Chromatiales bacterium]|nr:type II toxin-antitoxin system RelE/ParE family toxin [Chromatiales bacterium]